MQTDDVISFIPFMSHRIFISHSSTDAVIAAQICSQLEGKGVTCWIAPRDVSLGNEYGKSIIDAIENAEGFVLVLSSHSNKSRAVLAELEKAFSAGLPLFPVRIQDVVPSKQIELFVRSAQWLDAFAPPLNFHINRLADMLQPSGSEQPSRGVKSGAVVVKEGHGQEIPHPPESRGTRTTAKHRQSRQGGGE
jgi:hypothetical protein